MTEVDDVGFGVDGGDDPLHGSYEPVFGSEIGKQGDA